MIQQDLIEDINQRFIPFGGYSELSKYLPESDLIDMALFGGDTLFLTSFLTPDGFPEPAIDLQDYGYEPGQLLTVLDSDLKVLTQKVLTPLNIKGAETYCWGGSQDERSVLLTRHAGRYFFSFETYNGTKLLQVLVQTKVSPDEQQQLLQEWKVIEQQHSQKQVYAQLDELFVEFSVDYAPLTLFIAENIPSTKHLFSPKYQQTYNAGENIYISSANKNFVMSFRHLTSQPELTLLNLSDEDLVEELLSKSYSKIYEDPVNNLQYWLSADNTYRLDITLSDNKVISAERFALNILTLSMVGEGQSRLKLTNGIYSLKAARRLDPLQPSKTVRLNVRAKVID